MCKRLFDLNIRGILADWAGIFQLQSSLASAESHMRERETDYILRIEYERPKVGGGILRSLSAPIFAFSRNGATRTLRWIRAMYILSSSVLKRRALRDFAEPPPHSPVIQQISIHSETSFPIDLKRDKGTREKFEHFQAPCILDQKRTEITH